MHVGMFVCLYVCMYVCMYVGMYVGRCWSIYWYVCGCVYRFRTIYGYISLVHTGSGYRPGRYSSSSTVAAIAVAAPSRMSPLLLLYEDLDRSPVMPALSIASPCSGCCCCFLLRWPVNLLAYENRYMYLCIFMYVCMYVCIYVCIVVYIHLYSK